MSEVKSSQVGSLRRIIQTSLLVKFAVISVIGLLLLIPSMLIFGLIHERENLAGEVSKEICDKWGGSQTITGPILTIPFGDGKTQVYLMPEKLSVRSKLDS